MRRADWSNARRSFELGHAGCGALRIVLEFDGDDCSTTTADVSELQLQIEGAAEEKVDNVTTTSSLSAAQSSACGGTVVGASLAGPQAARQGRKLMLSAAEGWLGSGAACWKPFRQPGAGQHEGSGRLCVQHVCLHGNQALVWV